MIRRNLKERRVEWLKGSESAAWNFSDFKPFKAPGRYPKALRFELNGQTRVTTEVRSVRSIGVKELAKLKKQIRAQRAVSSIPATAEKALEILFRYR